MWLANFSLHSVRHLALSWLLVRGQFILNLTIFTAAIAPCYIYVVVVVYFRVVAFCGRKLRCVVTSWYHRVVASRSLLFSNCEPLSLSAYCHSSSRPQLRRNLSFRVTAIHTSPTLPMAFFVHLILTGQLSVHRGIYLMPSNLMGLKICKSAAILLMIHTVNRLNFISRQPLLWDIHLFMMVFWSNKSSSSTIAKGKDTL